MTDFDCDVLIVGGGVIGLACARELSTPGVRVALVEQKPGFGAMTSSRHSEVIHAGIYYPTDSLKAQTCTEGRRLLYAYLDANRIPYQKISKLIFASSPDELSDLEALYMRGEQNGVEGLTLVDRSELRSFEPALKAHAAIYSAETGIFDSHLYLKTLERDALAKGAMLALGTSFHSAYRLPGGWNISIKTPENQTHQLRATWLINTAGHGSHAVAKRIREYSDIYLPGRFLAQGAYWKTSQKLPFRRLLYPMPSSEGLGIHLTFDLSGGARFGPDVTWIDQEHYDLDPARKAFFVESIQRYFPELDPERLHPDYAGIRPKLVGPGEASHDFVVQGPTDHKCPGLVHCFGIESPGLTASLAFARVVRQTLGI